MAKHPKKQQNIAAAPAAPLVSAWEDDPDSGVMCTRPAPDLSKRPLAFTFPVPAPKPAQYPQGTPEFRYWTAAEALRRGADFWAASIPLNNWQMGASLPVKLDEGEDLNAYYDRSALNFFHGGGPSGTVYSGESPDVACHEMGHAILDALKPQLWNVASHEAAAFHKSFADISAILSALQLKSLRQAILNDTGGNLYRSSRLSRLAEQLGAAIRLRQPDAVDPDCLRNAVNSFAYQDPIGLPPMGPASNLSAEPHSFSRVFTGAFFEGLAGALTAMASNPKAPTEQELETVARDMGSILATSIKKAPVVSNWYAQVAAGMVSAAAPVNAAYLPVLKSVFVRRSILSLQSASAVQSFHMALMAAPEETSDEPLQAIALPSGHYGLDQPLLADAPSQVRRFATMSAAPDATEIDPASAMSAARSFVDDLFRSGRVNYGNFGRPEARLQTARRRTTHRLETSASAIRLERVLFDCAFCSGC